MLLIPLSGRKAVFSVLVQAVHFLELTLNSAYSPFWACVWLWEPNALGYGDPLRTFLMRFKTRIHSRVSLPGNDFYLCFSGI